MGKLLYVLPSFQLPSSPERRKAYLNSLARAFANLVNPMRMLTCCKGPNPNQVGRPGNKAHTSFGLSNNEVDSSGGSTANETVSRLGAPSAKLRDDPASCLGGYKVDANTSKSNRAGFALISGGKGE